jgi:hypothetical protein
MLTIGQVLKDGSVYAGHHPVEDAHLVCKEADELNFPTMFMENNKEFDKGVITWLGPDLFRVPSCDEQGVLRAYSQKIGGFVGDGHYGCGYKLGDEPFYIAGFVKYGQTHDTRVRFVRVVTQKELEALC